MHCQNCIGYAYTVDWKDDFVYEVDLHGEAFGA